MMCLSPHEMSTERIEQYIESIRQLIAERPNLEGRWSGRLEGLEEVLKERANAGTI